MKIHKDLKKLTRENEAYRRVLVTGKHSQLVLMSLEKGDAIGAEVHPDVDQIFYFVDGRAEVVVEGRTEKVDRNEAVFVPAGTKHDVRNVGPDRLKLFTVYSPPQHADGLVQETHPHAQPAHH